jgi:peptide/nickel transport system permease protein
MLRYTVRRLLALAPILLFISFVTFTLVRLAPGDPALIMVGGRRTTPEVLASIRAKYLLDRDPLTQYVSWASRALGGDLGESFRLKQQVRDLIAARLPLTLKLVGLSTLIAVVIALPLGILAAVYKNSWVDYLASIVALLGVSAPVFFTGIAGILIFSYWLKWLPAFGSGAGKGFLEELRSLALPSATLALGMIALNARMTRSAMIEALGSDYIEAARAKGLPERTVIIKHALRNALIPVITVLSLQMAFLIVGSVLVEYTFGLGGLGSLITDAIQNRDYPVVQGTVLLLATMFVLVNLATDLLYAVIDPRIRYG